MDYANIKINCITVFFYRCNWLGKKVAFWASMYAISRQIQRGASSPSSGLTSLVSIRRPGACFKIVWTVWRNVESQWCQTPGTITLFYECKPWCRWHPYHTQRDSEGMLGGAGWETSVSSTLQPLHLLLQSHRAWRPQIKMCRQAYPLPCLLAEFPRYFGCVCGQPLAHSVQFQQS